MKFYILTSSNLDTLKRHRETIPTDDQVVIINTKDDDYVRSATSYCRLNNIEHYVTKSDGTPATGKNSVMEKFLESNNNYMVQVDGDDFITDYGYKLYKFIAEDEDAPDLICLFNQWARHVSSWNPVDDGPDRIGAITRKQSWKRGYEARFDYFEENRFYRWLKTIPANGSDDSPHKGKPLYRHYPDGKLRLWAHYKCRWEKMLWPHCVGRNENDRDSRDCFNRMVFYSRKAAKLVKFDPELLIGEDTMAFWELKNKSFNGKLNIMARDEMETPSYMYDAVDQGTVMNESKKDTKDVFDDSLSYDWIVTLVKYMDKYNLTEKWKESENMDIPIYE